MTKKRKKLRTFLNIAIPLAVAVIAVAAFMAVRYYTDNIRSNFTKPYVLYVDSTSTMNSILDSLAENAGVVSEKSLRRMAEKEELALSFKVGRYEITPGMTSVYVMRMINNNWQSAAKLTIAGYIRDRGKLAKVLSRPLQADSSEMAAVLYDDDFLAGLGFTGDNVLAMILPDTYYVYWTTSPSDLMSRLKSEYDKFWDSTRLAKADSLGLTPVEVSTMASIVMEESNAKDEYPVIAGVYLNRLKSGMKLQADPTARFASGDFTLTRILYKHTRIDSPYNTYKYYGLPPAPINVPSKAAIDGVLNAEDHDYIYFCARPELDGRHNFAVTFSEHKRNARAYQSAYKEWARERAKNS